MREAMKGRLSWYLYKVKTKLNVDLEHTYNGFSILLPSNHMLPRYQLSYRNYDRFLPHLAKYLDDGSTVIDVGANCADTLAGMVEQNPTSKYICIEPDDVFMDYLTLNIERIRHAVTDLDVRTVKSLVGKSITNASLTGVGGTKHAVVGAGGKNSQPLDDILKDLACSTVHLMKSDVDGFDYDVIDSAKETLLASQPMLFFECDIALDYQKDGYKKTISWLDSIGYADWTIFDNYGEVMLRTTDVKVLIDLIDYAWNQHEGNAARTVRYYDVLAVASKDVPTIDRVLAAYRGTGCR